MLHTTVSYKPFQTGQFSPNGHNRAVKSINRWLISGPFEKKIQFEPVTMTGEINTWLLEGFSIHENPCRKEYVEERRKQPPQYPFQLEMPGPGAAVSQEGEQQSWSVYCPWDNPRVDHSGFWFEPTLLTTYAATQIEYDNAGRYKFSLRTCGAVTLWVDGTLVIDFVSYKRNKVQQTEFELELEQGVHLFEIRFEDLAERDTEYYFQLDEYSTSEPSILLPIAPERSEQWLQLEMALEASYFEKESVTDGFIALQLDNPLHEPIQVDVTWGNFFDGQQKKQIMLQPGMKQLELGHTDEIGMGYHYFTLDFWLDGLKLSKRIGMEACITLDPPPASNTIKERKQAALRFIADQGSQNIHTAVAQLHIHGPSDQTMAILYEGMKRIHAREDCSDFYLAGLFKLWKEYRGRGDDPYLTGQFWQQVKECMLSFRYWIDDPGSDVMWFFSENHALLFHACELFAGQLFPDERFSNSGKTGKEHRKQAESRLAEWFERFFEEGLAEWNSNAYIPVDALGLLHIYDLAESVELRQAAKRAMDQLFYYIAVHAHGGRLMTTFGRSYEKELKGHNVAGTSSMCWIAYGEGILNGYSLSNVIFSLCSYEAPADYAAYLKPAGKGFIFEYEQGKDGYARLYHYKTKDGVMSSIQDFRPGYAGYQEHIVHYAASPYAQAWINHPGELHSYGSGRPSFWAGNGTLPKAAQFKGLAVLHYQINPQHDAGYTHLFLPVDEYDEWFSQDNWLFARKDCSYIGVWTANGMKMTEQGANRRREWVSDGLFNTWVMRCSNVAEAGSFQQFAASLLAAGIENEPGLHIRLQDPEYGSAELYWEHGFTVNGQIQKVDGAGVMGRLTMLDEQTKE
ncbi:hypothetical protein V1L65_01795 [Paenibacillus sp. IITD108]